MDKVAAREVVSDTLERSFDFGRFTDLVGRILKRFDRERVPGQERYLPDSFRKHIAKLRRLGSYTDSDGNVLDIMVVDLEKGASLDRARSMQRNFVARCLTHREDAPRNGALVAFVAPNQADWRFSLVKMEYRLDAGVDVKKTITPARRYSFLVGENEGSHTAQSRLVPLLAQKKKPTLTELQKAFSVEPVTQEFFEKYRDLFLRLNAEIDRIAKTSQKVKRHFAEQKINTGSFAKRLLGQIVFLYFLQKKGWLGVEVGKQWGEGPKQFLRDLFERRHDFKRENKKQNFFKDVLEPLFYEALRYNRGVDDDYFNEFDRKIPFLNGGLFEPMKKYKWSEVEILIEDDLFSNEDGAGDGIFDVFDRYNFTVKEDEPLEKEVAVDPEMLGKVFENLLAVKDRKDKGTYYTPREIVHYMCQESLVNYLCTKLAGQVDPNDIRTLIYHGAEIVENDQQVAENEEETDTYWYRVSERTYERAPCIDDALAAIRICDPAIGSGAFPVGMMNEIVRARSALTGHGGLEETEERSAYNFKRHAIKESLYGVDIDPDAIDIAKLRLWLSLIVDEESRSHIKPLPNLDYKIVRGNALLDIEKDTANWDEAGKLQPLMDDFFNESDSNKQAGLQQEIERRLRKISGGKGEFAFWLYFAEAFRGGGRKGFDVIIANPPYVQLQKNNGELRKLYQDKGFETFARGGDIYQLFYEKGYRQLDDGGHLCFITSNKWMRADYGKLSRQFLAKSTLRAVVDFGELPVFKAGTDTAIVLTQNQMSAREHAFTVAMIKDAADIHNVREAVQKKSFEMALSDLSDGGWTLERPEVSAMLKKIRKARVSLREYVQGKIHYGIKTGKNKAFVIDKATKAKLISKDPKSAELIKPWLRGGDVKKWYAEKRPEWIIFARQGININAYPAIKKHLQKHRADLEPKKSASDTRGRAGGWGYKWYELQATVAYHKKFEEDKIVFNETSKELHAFVDRKKLHVNKTCFIIVAPDNDFLLGVMNSQMMDYYYRHTFPAWGDPWRGGRVQFRGNRMAAIPIAVGDGRQRRQIAQRVRKICKNPQSPQTPILEAEIDQLVYQLYGLTKKDIQHIESCYETDD